MMFSKKRTPKKNHTYKKTQKTQTKHSKQNSNERGTSSCLLAFPVSLLLKTKYYKGTVNLEVHVSSSEFFSHALTSPAAFWFLPLEFLDIGPPRTLLEFSLLFSLIFHPLSFILLCGDFNFTFQTFSLCQHCHFALTFL